MFGLLWQSYCPWHLEFLHILACILNSSYIFVCEINENTMAWAYVLHSLVSSDYFAYQLYTFSDYTDTVLRTLRLFVIYFHFTLIFIHPSLDVIYDGMVMSVRVSVCPSDSLSVWLSVRPGLGVRPFSALFSYMLWHIELKCCTWLCFNLLQIRFEFRHFASIFEGVMTLGELKI